MDKLEIVQAIGNEICEECGPSSDCGEEPTECGRVLSAIEYLDEYISNNQLHPTQKTGG